MALISNEKWMSIIMLIAIIIITLLLESYSFVVKSEAFVDGSKVTVIRPTLVQ
jgi:hypothetical protein